MKAFLLCVLIASVPVRAEAQNSCDDAEWVCDESEGARSPGPQLSVLAGLIQPILLRGGNVELDFHYRRLVLGYSHGFLLNLEGAAVVGAAKRQGLTFHLPYSTGLSVGYRLTEWLDVRVELKVHRFEAHDGQTGAPLFAYTTFTAGMGVYARYRPFFHGLSTNRFPKWAQGFVVVPSVRYWPKAWTSLSGDRREYDSPTTGERETHRALDIGMANTPLIVNVALGYLVQF